MTSIGFKFLPTDKDKTALHNKRHRFSSLKNEDYPKRKLTLDELIEGVDPMLDVSTFTVLVPDQGGLDILSSWQGSETHGWKTGIQQC